MSHCKFQEIIPRSDGAWCSHQHNRLIHGESLGNVFFPYHFHNFTVLGALAGIPKQAYRATGPTDWSFKCLKAWESILVHPAKVILFDSNLIYCLHIPFLVSTSPIVLHIVGEIEPVFNVMFFCLVLHRCPLKCDPQITAYSRRVSIHGPQLL